MRDARRWLAMDIDGRRVSDVPTLDRLLIGLGDDPKRNARIVRALVVRQETLKDVSEREGLSPERCRSIATRFIRRSVPRLLLDHMCPVGRCVPLLTTAKASMPGIIGAALNRCEKAVPHVT